MLAVPSPSHAPGGPRGLTRTSLSVALLCLVASCGAEPAPPNVVLLVMDTVRADHLSLYGYPQPTSTELEALGQRADVYRQCRATAPWTLPSHASMFTGLYPFQHGAQARARADGRIDDSLPLLPERRTLAEALSEEGYRTGAFVANGAYLGRKHQLDQGFDEYDEKTPREREPRRWWHMNEKALTWLGGLEAERPFFLFVNYMDAHRPYNVEPLENGPQLPPPDPAPPIQLLNELCEVILETDQVPDPELVRRVITQYDQGIANVDRGVGELLRELERRGLLENTLVIVTSDHGEYFGEHDLVEHSKDVYEPALHVPLVVKRPGQREGRVIDERISLVDLPSLVLAQLPPAIAKRHGADFPGHDSGRSAMAELRYTRGKDLSQAYGKRFLRERAVIYVGRFKFIRSTDGQHELYDLTADPGELRNLVGELPELAAQLQGKVERALAAGEQKDVGEPLELTQAELDQLRELGYVE